MVSRHHLSSRGTNKCCHSQGDLGSMWISRNETGKEAARSSQFVTSTARLMAFKGRDISDEPKDYNEWTIGVHTLPHTAVGSWSNAHEEAPNCRQRSKLYMLIQLKRTEELQSHSKIVRLKSIQRYMLWCHRCHSTTVWVPRLLRHWRHPRWPQILVPQRRTWQTRTNYRAAWKTSFQTSVNFLCISSIIHYEISVAEGLPRQVVRHMYK